MDEIGETCKLCLKYIQGDSVAALDEDLLAKLDFIQMDLDHSVEESNSICTECKEKIQNAFDFKFCLVQSAGSDPGASGSHAKNVCDIPSTSSSKSSSEKTICCVCKNSVAIISVISLEKLLKDDNVMEVFQRHIPEMEFKEFENSRVCDSCQKSLASFSMLVSSWTIANEWNEDDDMKEGLVDFEAVKVKKEDLDEFSESNANFSCAVDASDSGKIVKKSKGNQGQITKVKTEGDEISDSSESASVNKYVKKEENGEENQEEDLRLKDEEIDIKDEDGHGKNKDLKRNVRKIKLSELKNATNKSKGPQEKNCNEKQFRVNKNTDDLVEHQCSKCSYTTKHKRYLKYHMFVHKNDVKIFECTDCFYKTDRSTSFKYHLLKHKNPNEVEIFKCTHCKYQTKWKYSMSKHILVHRSPKLLELLECLECSFKTKSKATLSRHLSKHHDNHSLQKYVPLQTNSDEFETFKCAECSYTTKLKRYLRRHVLMHNSDAKIFECTECSYKTKRRTSFKYHLLKHKNSSEIEIYKCTECSYESKWKYSIQKHLLVHKNPHPLELFQCPECSFNSKWKASLNKHLLMHQRMSNAKELWENNLTGKIFRSDLDPSPTEQSNTFQCPKSPYKAKTKYRLNCHMLTHKSLDEVKTFKCAQCPYLTFSTFISTQKFK